MIRSRPLICLEKLVEVEPLSLALNSTSLTWVVTFLSELLLAVDLTTHGLNLLFLTVVTLIDTWPLIHLTRGYHQYATSPCEKTKSHSHASSSLCDTSLQLTCQLAVSALYTWQFLTHGLEIYSLISILAPGSK